MACLHPRSENSLSVVCCMSHTSRGYGRVGIVKCPNGDRLVIWSATVACSPKAERRGT